MLHYYGKSHRLYKYKLSSLQTGEKFLNDKGIEFEERNIELEEKYAEEAWNMGVRAVPVTLIGEYKIMGMNMTQFNKALAEA